MSSDAYESKNEANNRSKSCQTLTVVADYIFDADKDGLSNVCDLGIPCNIPDDSKLNNTGIFYHKDMTLHECEDDEHVEKPDRITNSYSNLKYYGLLSKCKEYKCNQIDLKTLSYTHPKQHVSNVLRGYHPNKIDSKPNNDDSGEIDSDTFYNEHTPKAALVCDVIYTLYLSNYFFIRLIMTRLHSQLYDNYFFDCDC